jgi:thiol:disulfide interchange protein DsbA
VLETFTSFGVSTKVTYASDMTRRYQTNGVPTIIVDGIYQTKVSMAGGPNELIDLINYLAAKAQEER